MVKISAALVSAVLVASAMSTSATFLNDAMRVNNMRVSEIKLEQTNATDYFDDLHIKYYFACISGAIGGFSQGIYANTS
jgi:hypothetical protein